MTTSRRPPTLSSEPARGDGGPSDRAVPTRSPENGEAGGAPSQPLSREELLLRRRRRQRVLHRGPGSRLGELQPWLLVLLALAAGLGWLLGRDACTRSIERTYGTLSGTHARDAGESTRPAAPARSEDGRPAEVDDGW